MISIENVGQMRELTRYRKRMFGIEETLSWNETPPEDKECAQLAKEPHFCQGTASSQCTILEELLPYMICIL